MCVSVPFDNTVYIQGVEIQLRGIQRVEHRCSVLLDSRCWALWCLWHVQFVVCAVYPWFWPLGGNDKRISSGQTCHRHHILFHMLGTIYGVDRGRCHNFATHLSPWVPCAGGVFMCCVFRPCCRASTVVIWLPLMSCN